MVHIKSKEKKYRDKILVDGLNIRIEGEKKVSVN